MLAKGVLGSRWLRLFLDEMALILKVNLIQ